MPTRIWREKVHFLHLPPASASASDAEQTPPRIRQFPLSLSLSLSFFHPRNARPLPHTHSPAQPQCPSFPRQSSRKEGAGPAAAQPPPPCPGRYRCYATRSEARVHSCLQCTLSISAAPLRSRSSTRRARAGGGGSGNLEDKIEIALHMGAQGVICRGRLQSFHFHALD